MEKVPIRTQQLYGLLGERARGSSYVSGARTLFLPRPLACPVCTLKNQAGVDPVQFTLRPMAQQPVALANLW